MQLFLYTFYPSSAPKPLELVVSVEKTGLYSSVIVRILLYSHITMSSQEATNGLEKVQVKFIAPVSGAE